MVNRVGRQDWSAPTRDGLLWIPREQNNRDKFPNSGVLFWIDVMCIPHDPDLRQKAIRNMRKIYERATVVLVLDSWVRELNVASFISSPTTEGEDLKEIVLRLYYCTWYRRLWTLQEALMSHRLVFQFEDGAVDLEFLRRLYMRRNHSGTYWKVMIGYPLQGSMAFRFLMETSIRYGRDFQSSHPKSTVAARQNWRTRQFASLRSWEWKRKSMDC